MKGNDKGQLLVEVLIALTVISVVLVASLSVSIKSIRLARTAKNRIEATKVATNVIEQLKASKESDVDSFFVNKVCPTCGPFGTNNIYSCTLACNFTDTFVTVKVSIDWQEAGNTTQVSLDTVLTRAKL